MAEQVTDAGMPGATNTATSNTTQTNGCSPTSQQTEAEIDAIITRGITAYQWIYQERAAGRLQPYQGQYIAVVNQTIIASDQDPDRLEHTVVEQLGLQRNHVVITYIEGLE